MKYSKVEEFPNYEISKEGFVRNVYTKKILSQYVSSTGYYMVSLSLNNKPKKKRVHRLIAKYYIKNPQNKPCINHKDGNKLNNNFSNLEWCTVKENNQHAFNFGLTNNTGINNGMSKLNNSKVKIIKKMLADGISQQKIADRFAVSRSCILKINLGKTWNHVNLKIRL